MNDTEKKYLSKKELCDLLGVSIGKIELMMGDNMDYIKFGRNVRFDIEDVLRYMNSRKVNSHS
jgi:excisionase family DNA binding protein